MLAGSVKVSTRVGNDAPQPWQEIDDLAAAGPEVPVTDYVAAVSVGKVGEAILLDLNYEEDSSAHVDMNIVKTGRGLFVEVQGTAEGQPFSEDEMRELMEAGDKGIKDLVTLQKAALGDFTPKVGPAPR